MTRATLPERPHVDHLRGQAKRLLKAAREDQPAARGRIACYFDPLPDPIKLHHAQLTIAREYGYASWRDLMGHVTELRAAADELVRATRDDDVGRMAQILDAHPGLVRTVVDRDRGVLPADGARMGLLHLCAAEDRPEAARLLLERGAQIDLRNRDGRTALHDALEYGRGSLTDLLIDRGADVDACAAALMGNVERLRELSSGDPDAFEDCSTGLSVLGWASYGGHPEVLHVLVEHGVEIEAFDGLFPAAQCDHAGFIAKAIELGADVRAACGPKRRTALHEAVQLRYTEHATRTVNVLLDAGADINALDADGKTPLDLAIETAETSDDHRRDFDALIALLQRSGAHRNTG